MDMTSETIREIAKLAVPNIVEHEGWRYTDKHLTRLNEPGFECYGIKTLRGLVDLVGVLQAKFGGESMMCVIGGPLEVGVYLSSYDDDRRKRQLIQVEGEGVCEFRFGRFMEPDDFCLSLLSNFVVDDEARRLFDVVSSLTTSVVATHTDTGIAQHAVLKTGVVAREGAVISPTFELRPFRTFPDIDQPASQFLFRLKQVNNAPPLCALFEADGGAWKVAVRQNIKAWLQVELGDKVPVVA